MVNYDFFKCGVTGWCLEVLWTGSMSALHHDYSMAASTSLLMFPIYGMGAAFKPVSNFLDGNPVVIRGMFYMLCIFAIEYSAGSILKSFHACPWNYENAKYNINGLIRLDYAPLWFSVGLLFEKLLNPGKCGRHAHKK